MVDRLSKTIESSNFNWRDSVQVTAEQSLLDTQASLSNVSVPTIVIYELRKLLYYHDQSNTAQEAFKQAVIRELSAKPGFQEIEAEQLWKQWNEASLFFVKYCHVGSEISDQFLPVFYQKLAVVEDILSLVFVSEFNTILKELEDALQQANRQ